MTSGQMRGVEKIHPSAYINSSVMHLNRSANIHTTRLTVNKSTPGFYNTLNVQSLRRMTNVPPEGVT